VYPGLAQRCPVRTGLTRVSSRKRCHRNVRYKRQRNSMRRGKYLNGLSEGTVSSCRQMQCGPSGQLTNIQCFSLHCISFTF
jgi:hypothetical protein